MYTVIPSNGILICKRPFSGMHFCYFQSRRKNLSLPFCKGQDQLSHMLRHLTAHMHPHTPRPLCRVKGDMPVVPSKKKTKKKTPKKNNKVLKRP